MIVDYKLDYNQKEVDLLKIPFIYQSSKILNIYSIIFDFCRAEIVIPTNKNSTI